MRGCPELEPGRGVEPLSSPYQGDAKPLSYPGIETDTWSASVTTARHSESPRCRYTQNALGCAGRPGRNRTFSARAKTSHATVTPQANCAPEIGRHRNQAGLEPARPFRHQLSRPECLPIPPLALERRKGIEPSPSGWEPGALPLSYPRVAGKTVPVLAAATRVKSPGPILARPRGDEPRDRKSRSQSGVLESGGAPDYKTG